MRVKLRPSRSKGKENKSDHSLFFFEEEDSDSTCTVSFTGNMLGVLSDMKQKNQKCLGLLLMGSAGLFLTLGNSLVQFVYDKNPTLHISSFEVLFVRSLIQLLFTLILMIYGKVHIYGNQKKNLIPLIEMGITEVCAIVFIYLALEKMPVGEVTVIQFTAPIFTVLFSFVFLRKGCGFVEAIFGAISFLGVVIIAKPDLLGFTHTQYDVHTNMHKTDHLEHANHNYVQGTMFSLLAAVSLSLFFILNKLNGMNVDVLLTIFYPSVFGVIIGPIIMAVEHKKFYMTEITGEYWGILIVVGFVSFIGLLFMGEALQLEDAGPAVLIRNCDVIYAFILQYLLMHHIPSKTALIGTLIVLACTSVIAINRVFQIEEKYRNKYCCKSCQSEIEDMNKDETRMMLSAKQEEDEDEEEIVLK